MSCMADFWRFFRSLLGSVFFGFFFGKSVSDPPPDFCSGSNTWVVATQIFFMFTPILGEMIQFDEHIFQMGGKTPPTRTSSDDFHLDIDHLGLPEDYSHDFWKANLNLGFLVGFCFGSWGPLLVTSLEDPWNRFFWWCFKKMLTWCFKIFARKKSYRVSGENTFQEVLNSLISSFWIGEDMKGLDFVASHVFLPSEENSPSVVSSFVVWFCHSFGFD